MYPHRYSAICGSQLVWYVIISPDCTMVTSLRWRHNGRDGVSNHLPHDCLLNRLFERRWKKTSKPRVTGLCVGKSPGPVNSPHKWPVTRKLFPFDDVIMLSQKPIMSDYWDNISWEVVLRGYGDIVINGSKHVLKVLWLHETRFEQRLLGRLQYSKWHLDSIKR